MSSRNDSALPFNMQKLGPISHTDDVTPSRTTRSIVPGDGELGRIVLFLVAAVGLQPILAFVYPSIISDLPRSMQGEAVVVPWAACWLGYWLVAVIAPWAASRTLLSTSRQRIALLVIVLVAALVCYGCLGEALLSKAWRRGL